MRIYAAAWAMILLATSDPVAAQSATARTFAGDRTDIAGVRAQSGYDPIGIAVGAWSLAPALRLTSGADDNVFGEQGGGRGDGFAVIAPSLRIEGDFGRWGLRLAASSDSTRYFRFTEQNTDEYAVRTDGSVAIADAVVVPSVEFSRVAERRGTSGVPLTFREPSLLQTSAQAITVRNAFASITASLSARHSKVNYNDLLLPNGTIVSQSFRNTESWSFNGRAGYAFSSALALFATGEYGHGRSTDPIIPRTNDSQSLRAGATLDIDMIRADISVGYLQQQFGNPVFPDFSGLDYDASLRWSPTRFVTVTAQTRRSLENSGIVNVGAILTRTDRADLVYEMYRNLSFRLIYNDRRERYREVDIRSSSRAVEFRADLAFNRNVALGAYARRQCRDSAIAMDTQNGAVLRSFCASIAGLSVILRQ